MAGPYPPLPPSGPGGQPLPGAPAPAPAETYLYPDYTPPMPPPVAYGQPGAVRPRSRALLWGLLALGLVAALVITAVIIGSRANRAGTTSVSEAEAKTAIQTYLTALSEGNYEDIARNNLCGMFDAIKDRKGDMALARLASDAFRKQFSSVEITTVDKIVMASANQAQVLFSMKVQPAETGRKTRGEEQGVAQLLRQDNQLLVCSYLLRTAGQY